MCIKVNMDKYKVGNVFNSFKELEEEIKVFEQESFVNLVKRHSRSIENARKRGSTKTVVSLITGKICTPRRNMS